MNIHEDEQLRQQGQTLGCGSSGCFTPTQNSWELNMQDVGIHTEQPSEPRAGMEHEPSYAIPGMVRECEQRQCYPSVLSPLHSRLEIILPQGAATVLTFLGGHRAVSFQ